MDVDNFRRMLLALWDEAHNTPEVMRSPDFVAWSGTTKDMLIGLGLIPVGLGYDFKSEDP